jgi:hypothetical protein
MQDEEYRGGALSPFMKLPKFKSKSKAIKSLFDMTERWLTGTEPCIGITIIDPNNIKVALGPPHGGTMKRIP